MRFAGLTTAIWDVLKVWAINLEPADSWRSLSIRSLSAFSLARRCWMLSIICPLKLWLFWSVEE